MRACAKEDEKHAGDTWQKDWQKRSLTLDNSFGLVSASSGTSLKICATNWRKKRQSRFNRENNRWNTWMACKSTQKMLCYCPSVCLSVLSSLGHTLPNNFWLTAKFHREIYLQEYIVNCIDFFKHIILLIEPSSSSPVVTSAASGVAWLLSLPWRTDWGAKDWRR